MVPVLPSMWGWGWSRGTSAWPQFSARLFRCGAPCFIATHCWARSTPRLPPRPRRPMLPPCALVPRCAGRGGLLLQLLRGPDPRRRDRHRGYTEEGRQAQGQGAQLAGTVRRGERPGLRGQTGGKGGRGQPPPAGPASCRAAAGAPVASADLETRPACPCLLPLPRLQVGSQHRSKAEPAGAVVNGKWVPSKPGPEGTTLTGEPAPTPRAPCLLALLAVRTGRASLRVAGWAGAGQPRPAGHAPKLPFLCTLHGAALRVDPAGTLGRPLMALAVAFLACRRAARAVLPQPG